MFLSYLFSSSNFYYMCFHFHLASDSEEKYTKYVTGYNNSSEWLSLGPSLQEPLAFDDVKRASLVPSSGYCSDTIRSGGNGIINPTSWKTAPPNFKEKDITLYSNGNPVVKNLYLIWIQLRFHFYQILLVSKVKGLSFRFPVCFTFIFLKKNLFCV